MEDVFDEDVFLGSQVIRRTRTPIKLKLSGGSGEHISRLNISVTSSAKTISLIQSFLQNVSRGEI